MAKKQVFSIFILSLAIGILGCGRDWSLESELKDYVPDGAAKLTITPAEIDAVPTHRVTFTRDLTVGRESDGVLLAGPLNIAVAEDGRFFVARGEEVEIGPLVSLQFGGGAGARKTPSGKFVRSPGVGGGAHTVSRQGRRYSAITRFYEILSVASESRSWALKGPTGATSVSVDDLPEMPTPSPGASQPEALTDSEILLPTIRSLKTDGAERLFVCLYGEPREDDLATCHVYSSDGELQFVALVEDRFVEYGGPCMVARGSHVYG